MTTGSSSKKGINNGRNRQEIGLNSVGCQNILRDLGYTRIPSSSSKVIPDIIVDVLTRFGNLPSNRLMLNVRMLTLSDKDLCTGYEQLASSISSVFGSIGAGVVLESIKQELQQYLLAKTSTNDMANAYLIHLETRRTLKDLLCRIGRNASAPEGHATKAGSSTICQDPQSIEAKARTTINEITDKIQILDTFENISQLSSQHILLLYGNEGNKDSILSSIFPSRQVMSSNDSESGVKKGSSMLSNTWLVENGFVDEIASLEESLNEIDEVGKQEIRLYGNDHSGASIICAYDMAMISKEELTKVIQSHRYVILDEPFVLYKMEK